jgi:hypothetical protein
MVCPYGNCLKTEYSAKHRGSTMSPDHGICDFYLWINLKGKFYKSIHRSTEDQQKEMTHVTGSVTVDKIQKLSHRLITLFEAILQAMCVGC